MRWEQRLLFFFLSADVNLKILVMVIMLMIPGWLVLPIQGDQPRVGLMKYSGLFKVLLNVTLSNRDLFLMIFNFKLNLVA